MPKLLEKLKSLKHLTVDRGFEVCRSQSLCWHVMCEKSVHQINIGLLHAQVDLAPPSHTKAALLCRQTMMYSKLRQIHRSGGLRRLLKSADLAVLQSW